MDGFTGADFNSGLECDLTSNEHQEPLITARLALSEDVKKEAWSVRHAAYAAQGLIVPNESKMLNDKWDFSSSTKILVIYKNGMPVSTCRISVYAPNSGIMDADDVPSMAMFEQEIPKLYETIPSQGRFAIAIDISRLGRHPLLGADYRPVFALYRMISYLLLHYEADAVISAVQKHHIPFYRRMGFTKAADPKAHPKLNLQAALMAGIRDPSGHLREVLPTLGLVSVSDSNYLGFVAGERVPVFGTGQAPAELSGLFGGRMEGERKATLVLARRGMSVATDKEIAIAA